jgi:hypothetical protein
MKYDWLVRITSLHKEGEQLGFDIKPSKIHGEGVFSTQPMVANEIVGIALVPIEENNFQKVYQRNRLGLKINHSSSPNGRLCKRNDGYFLIVIVDVPQDEEVTVDYDDYYKQMQQEIEDTGKSVYVL